MVENLGSLNTLPKPHSWLVNESGKHICFLNIFVEFRAPRFRVQSSLNSWAVNITRTRYHGRAKSHWTLEAQPSPSQLITCNPFIRVPIVPQLRLSTTASWGLSVDQKSLLHPHRFALNQLPVMILPLPGLLEFTWELWFISDTCHFALWGHKYELQPVSCGCPVSQIGFSSLK